MKYIRTKDNIIEVNPTLTDEQIDISQGKNTPRADTIEKLCDEYVRVYKTMNNRSMICDKELAISSSKRHKHFDVYGAIWTSKGLIYVAKMNEKGVLDLL